MQQDTVTRRGFLSTTMAGVAGLTAGAALGNDDEASDKPIPQRPFGRHNEQVSLLGVGGYHIGMAEKDEGIHIIQEAVDRGATFMDNAWCYHQGESEKRMGLALEGARREKAFLMTKHHGRTKQVAMQHLEDSLKRFRTDHIDLWQFHEIVYGEDADMIFGKDGGIEAAELAKKQGKVRYVGFTGHKNPWMLLKMLAHEYPWDAVQMPLNPFDATFESFEKRVLPVLVKRGIAVLAMKTRASGAILRSGACTPEQCWRYVAGLPVSTIISGMESLNLLHKNIELATTLKPMTETERAALAGQSAKMAASGEHERYKTSQSFDSTTGRKIHGIS